ncbi:MAG TPA: cytochrome C oxidase subunit IV family protein [Bacteroidales bacterium]|nr:cytochrome C oxidase subunit IV family protein [Bacteroidales bacterium]
MEMSRSEGIRAVKKGLLLLGAVTVAEVLISLLGKGYLIPGLEEYSFLFVITGLAMIVLSLYKAYFIVYEFMHLRYEVKGMALSILLPAMLLIWGLIAFLWEGNTWGDRREEVQYEIPQDIEQQLDESEGEPVKELDNHEH